MNRGLKYFLVLIFVLVKVIHLHGQTCNVTARSTRTSINLLESFTLTQENCTGTVSWTKPNGATENSSSIIETPTTIGTFTYTVNCRISPTNICTDEITIRVYPTCSITGASSRSQIKVGERITLSSTGCAQGTVSWQTSLGESITNIVNYEPAFNVTSFTARCNYFESGGSCIATVPITIYPECSIVASASRTTISNRESTTLSSTGCTRGVVSWRTSSGVAIPNNELTVNPQSTTTYVATCTNGTVQTCTSSVEVEVVPFCGVSATNSAPNILVTQTSQLSATGCPGTLVWLDPSNNQLVGTSPVVQPLTSGNYTARCTTTAGVCTSVTRVNVFPVCNVTASATALEVYSGFESQLTYTGCAGGTLNWVNTSTNGTLTGLNPLVYPTATTTYRANCTYPQLSNNNTNNCTSTVTINVFPRCDLVGRATSNGVPTGTTIVVTAGASVTLSHTGCTQGTVSWQQVGAGIVSTTINPIQSSLYRATCRLGNTLRCESDIFIKVNPVCTVTARSTSTSISPGEPITLINSGCEGGFVFWSDNVTGIRVNPFNPSPVRNTVYKAECRYADQTGNNCTSTVAVNVNYTIIITNVEVAKPICFNGSNGTMKVTLNRFPFGRESSTRLTLLLGSSTIGTYNTTTNTFPEITGLRAGSYTLRVETLEGTTVVATATQNTTITDGDRVILTTTKKDILCFGGADGELRMAVTGGKLPYRYELGGNNIYVAFASASTTTQTLVKQRAGTYSIKIQDSQNCISEAVSTTIAQPTAALRISSFTATDPLGFDTKDGKAVVTVEGGTPNYIFEYTDDKGVKISNGVTSNITNNTISTLRGGNFILTVTDRNFATPTEKSDKAGCTVERKFSLVEPDQLKIEFTEDKNPSCFDRADGQFSLKLSGGIKKETSLGYDLRVRQKVGTYDSNDQLLHSNIPGGVYVMTITDKNNISRTIEYTLTTPPAIVPKVVSTKDLVCTGENTGSVEISVTGGKEPYQIKWSNERTGLKEVGLAAGKYTAVVTDANNCDALIVAEVKEPAKLKVSLDISKPSCIDSCNGRVFAKITGGIAPYQVLWKDLTTKDLNLTKLCQGSSQAITVTDKNNCIATATNTMPTLTRLSIPLVKEKVVCAGSEVWLDATTVSAKSYSWTLPNNTKATSSQMFTKLMGSYKLSVFDSTNCEFRTDITLKASTIAAPKYFFTAPSTVGINEKFVAVNLIEPLPSRVDWILPNTAFDVQKTNIRAEAKLKTEGEYQIGMNALMAQCEAYSSTKVKVVNTFVGAQANASDYQNIAIGQNPNTGKFSLLFNLKANAEVVIEVYDVDNQNIVIYNKQVSVHKNERFNIDLGQVNTGLYLVKVQAGNDIFTQKIQVNK